MKKILLIIAIVAGCIGMQAAPVSLEEARTLANKFVSGAFEPSRQSNELNMVYSTPSFYVFNVGKQGFVILSADDSYSPVIGYSMEGAFEPDNMAPALQEYFRDINDYRMQRGAVEADELTAENWQMLRKYGHMKSRFGGRDATFLLTTEWDQNYPYNYYCPADAAGPGGHAYAGCVATAAGQVMKFWNSPVQGTGSHSYIPADNPQYGEQTADFGATTYDWANMPNKLSSSSPAVQKEAIGTLLYHCGVAVDMNYKPNGSGASTVYLCTVMPQYFGYCNNMNNTYREDCTKEQYLNIIYNNIDKGWPLLHRGGGHAYVVDGYDDNGLVHINWGWSGSNNMFFDIDSHGYTETQSVIDNCVPAAVYAATPNVATNIVATNDSSNPLEVTLTWNNPAVSLTNQALTSLDRVVVMRDNSVIYTNDEVTPGAAMTFVDNTIPYFDPYTYRIYAESEGLIGESAYSETINVGPLCQWKFIVTSSNWNGWGGAYIALYTGIGTEFGRVTTDNSSTQNLFVDIPLGKVKMVWVPNESSSTANINIVIKNTQNVSVFSYTGPIANMTEGVFYTGNNDCGNDVPTEAPSDLIVANDGNNMILSWNGVSVKDGYGYNIYRDDVLIKLTNENEYIDEDLPIGGHCYQVCYLGNGGPSPLSNEACGTIGEGCESGSDLWYEVQSNYKPTITWVAPEDISTLSGYYVFRKTEADEEYTRIGIIGKTKTEYKEIKALEDNTVYYYKIVPYYKTIDCFAAPIKSKFYDEYHVKYYYSIDNIDDVYGQSVNVYPNPTNGNVKIEARALENVMVFNLIGQKVYEENVSGNEYVLDMNRFGSGIYMIKIKSESGFTTKKITVIE